MHQQNVLRTHSTVLTRFDMAKILIHMLTEDYGHACGKLVWVIFSSDLSSGGNDSRSSSKRYTKVAHLGRLVHFTPNRESVAGRFL